MVSDSEYMSIGTSVTHSWEPPASRRAWSGERQTLGSVLSVLILSRVLQLSEHDNQRIWPLPDLLNFGFRYISAACSLGSVPSRVYFGRSVCCFNRSHWSHRSTQDKTRVVASMVANPSATCIARAHPYIHSPETKLLPPIPRRFQIRVSVVPAKCQSLPLFY
jgi:hypothetical protein